MTQGLLLPLPLRQFRPKLRSKYMFDKKLYSYDMCSYIIRLIASLLVLERPQALLGLFHCHTEKRRSYLLNLRSHLTGSRIRDCLVRTRTLSITLIFFFTAIYVRPSNVQLLQTSEINMTMLQIAHGRIQP